MSAEDVRARRRAVRHAYRGLFDRVEAILFDEDPIGINFEDNTDEYEPEVETIVPRLGACADADAVLTVVHEEFVRWFDPATAGPRERYGRIATRIWTELASWQPPA
jgi:hypothetical protein